MLPLTPTAAVVIAAIATAIGQAEAPHPARWLAGCWELRAGPRVTTEMWMPPAGGVMLSAARTVVRDTLRQYEFVRLAPRAGTLTYSVIPSGQAEAHFPATHVSDTLLVFEDPAHDFPQKVVYERRGADSLLAYIEGPRNGQTRRIGYPMRRVRCEG